MIAEFGCARLIHEIDVKALEANLRSGRIRMLFVADRISKELTRIVEFLNEQMRPAEVLAIEIEHFLGADGMRTLVPRLVGATARAQTVKSVQAPLDPLDESEWFQSLAEKFGPTALQGAERLIRWLRDNDVEVEQTKSQDSLAARITRSDGKLCWPFFVRRSTGRLEIALGNLIHVPAYVADTARKEVLDRIKQLPTSTLKATEKLNGWPSISLEDLMKDDLWSAYCSLASDLKTAIETH